MKTHSAGVLASMARLACKAERLECIADIRDACEPAPTYTRRRLEPAGHRIRARAERSSEACSDPAALLQRHCKGAPALDDREHVRHVRVDRYG